jgi:hypothetical protein
LICTTEEFDQLAKEVGIGSHKNGVTEEGERMAIRAKLDAIVGHLYELNLDRISTYIKYLSPRPRKRQNCHPQSLPNPVGEL